MKKTNTVVISVILTLVCILSFTACSDSTAKTDLWENALYTENTEFGSGEKTVQVEVRTPERSVTFTVNTDKDTLGDALLEHALVAGDEGPYGLYVKSVNGIIADYDVDQSYWAFSQNGEAMMTGIDGAEISDGDHYELVYTK